MSIVYLAKLSVNGRVASDLFSEWDTILGGNRINLNHSSQESYKASAGRFNAYQSTPRVNEAPSSSGASMRSVV